MILPTVIASATSAAAGAWGGMLVASSTDTREWVAMGLGFLAGPTAIIITHLLTRRKLAQQDTKVEEVEKKVQVIDVHVNGHLSSMTEMMQEQTDRIAQLVNALEGSDTAVPPDPNVIST